MHQGELGDLATCTTQVTGKPPARFRHAILSIRAEQWGGWRAPCGAPRARSPGLPSARRWGRRSAGVACVATASHTGAAAPRWGDSPQPGAGGAVRGETVFAGVNFGYKKESRMVV